MTLKNASKSMLLKHKNSVKHKRSFEFAKGSVDITQLLRKEATTESHQIAKSEIMFAAYFAEHDIPFANIDHLLDVCKLAFPNSKIAKNLSMKRTKLSYVIQDRIAFEETRFVADICMNQKFSISIDESTYIHKVSGVLCDRKLSAKVKGKMYKSVVRPTMLYGMETVAATERQIGKMEVAELKMVRWALGVTRKDKIRNEYVRGTAKIAKLGDKLRNVRLRWYGHVKRREEDYVGKRMIEMAVPGRRKR